MRIVWALPASLIALLTLEGCARSGGEGSGSTTSALFERARNKDVEGLVRLEAEAMSSASPIERNAYHIARYMADPERYADRFVDEFPESGSEIMGAVYQIELAKAPDGERLTPRFLYSFDELGKLAGQGQPAATRKLYIVAINSDGVVTDFVCGAVSAVLTNQTAIALKELGTLSGDQRKELYSCFSTASMTEADALRSAIGRYRTGENAPVAQEVLAALGS